MELITRTINSRPTVVRPHATVLQACEAAGREIPRFCYHEKLSVAGNCRRCLVEVYKSPKPVVACARPVSKGRIVYTNTPLVKKARESVLEFLLLNHPLDCPICDQGGECDLQDEAVTFGSDRSRFYEFKRSVEDKECGPIIKTIRTRCIHCTRCIRFSSEITGQETLGSFGRGEDTEIGTYVQSFIRTELAGNLVDLCPVGALTSKPYAYTARNWELQRVETLDFFDAVCSDIIVQTRGRTVSKITIEGVKTLSQDEIFRILPRSNGLYTDNWISDRTRYSFDGLKHNRVLEPYIRSSQNKYKKYSIKSFLENISSFFLSNLNKSNFHFSVGSHANIERVYALTAFSKRRSASSKNCIKLQNEYARNINVDIPFFYSLNRSFSSLSDGSSGGFLFMGTNPRYEASLFNTTRRREQIRRALPIRAINTFSPLRYTYFHGGNSLRALQSIFENRLDQVSQYRVARANYSIFRGVESSRRSQGNLFQIFFIILAKRLFSKTTTYSHFGTIHSSVASRAFAFIGIGNSPIKKATDLEQTDDIFFTVDSANFYNKNIINSIAPLTTRVLSFSTHQIEGISAATYNLPLTSLYERSGHFYILEGRFRKHYKAVTKPKATRNLETALTAFCRIQNPQIWASWTESLSFLNHEFPRGALIEQKSVSFSFALILFGQTEKQRGVFTPFFTTIRDYYLQDQISTFSPTRGACSLFIGDASNFHTER